MLVNTKIVSMARKTEEKIYECPIRAKYLRDGRKVRDWKTVSVSDAISEGASEFRCKDCHGAVKLHGRHVAHGPARRAQIAPGF